MCAWPSENNWRKKKKKKKPSKAESDEPHPLISFSTFTPPQYRGRVHRWHYSCRDGGQVRELYKGGLKDATRVNTGGRCRPWAGQFRVTGGQDDGGLKIMAGNRLKDLVFEEICGDNLKNKKK